MTGPRAPAWRLALPLLVRLRHRLGSSSMPELGKTVDERTKDIYRGGLTIQTTLDPKIQKHRPGGGRRKRVPIGNDKSHRCGGRTSPSRAPARCWRSRRTPSYTVGKQSRGKTASTGPLDKQYGGSGGFQFGSTAKAFALVTAMESGMTVNARVNAKPPAHQCGDLHSPRLRATAAGRAPRGGSSTTARRRRPDDPDEGDRPVDQHRVRRPRPAGGRLQGAATR